MPQVEVFVNRKSVEVSSNGNTIEVNPYVQEPIEVTEQKTVVEVNTNFAGVRSVAGKTGDVTLEIEDVEGLEDALNNGSGDRNREFEQAIPSTLWSITHNFGKRPAVTILTSAGDVVWAAINHIDDNSLTVSFTNPFSGKVVLN